MTRRYRTRPIQLVQNNVWPLRTSVNYVKQVAYIIYNIYKIWGYHGTPFPTKLHHRFHLTLNLRNTKDHDTTII